MKFIYKYLNDRSALNRFFSFIVFSILILFVFLERNRLSNIFLPFIIGIFISYILNPIVVFLVDKGMKRWVAVSLLYFFLIGSITIALVFVVPLTLIELNKLINAVPSFTEEAQQILDGMRERYKDILPLSIQETIDNNLKYLESSVLDFIQTCVDRTITLLSSLLSVILGPIIGFYILKDLGIIKTAMLGLVPVSYRKRLLKILKTIDITFGNYIRAQILVCFLVGFMTAISLYILKVEFAILIGFIAGITNIIPYFGPFIGALPAVLISALRYPQKIIWIVIIITVIHQLESGIISPNILGKKVGLHPLTVILSLLAGGSFFGFWGLIFGVPTAALLKLLLIPYLTKTKTG
ncbi:MAG: AI-2E family transporter [Thermoanaerobacterales bacterium]|jgi:predicted PurR-regulated permease PerM|nr:AI-2E family transporter [Thermoanaerobacterales bacterium]